MRKFFQHRVDLQRLRDRLGTLIPDGVVPEVEGGQDRVDLQRLRDRLGTMLGTHVTNLVDPKIELGQDPIENA